MQMHTKMNRIVVEMTTEPEWWKATCEMQHKNSHGIGRNSKDDDDDDARRIKLNARNIQIENGKWKMLLSSGALHNFHFVHNNSAITMRASAAEFVVAVISFYCNAKSLNEIQRYSTINESPCPIPAMKIKWSYTPYTNTKCPLYSASLE